MVAKGSNISILTYLMLRSEQISHIDCVNESGKRKSIASAPRVRKC